MDRGKTSDRFFYCLMSDGELDEGQSWEAILLAGREKLGNLIAIVDINGMSAGAQTFPQKLSIDFLCGRIGRFRLAALVIAHALKFTARRLLSWQR